MFELKTNMPIKLYYKYLNKKANDMEQKYFITNKSIIQKKKIIIIHV